jgi:23S rRNA (pseudouridine1915-N3)-methyltransferase
MHILIAAIGRLKSGPELALFEHYAARLAWKITVREYEIKKAMEPAARKQQEAALLLKACADAGHILALDARGVQMTSPELAAHLRKTRDHGAQRIAFVIGGADGLHETILAQAQTKLSFGRVTWPHALMRALLAEQLYRAQSILSGHPYHRE